MSRACPRTWTTRLIGTGSSGETPSALREISRTTSGRRSLSLWNARLPRLGSTRARSNPLDLSRLHQGQLFDLRRCTRGCRLRRTQTKTRRRGSCQNRRHSGRRWRMAQGNGCSWRCHAMSNLSRNAYEKMGLWLASLCYVQDGDMLGDSWAALGPPGQGRYFGGLPMWCWWPQVSPGL